MKNIYILPVLLFFMQFAAFGQSAGEFEKLEKDFFRLVWIDHDSMEIALSKMEEIALTTSSNEYLAKSRNARGTYFYSISEYTKALIKYNEAYRFAEEWNDDVYIGKVLNNIAACHLELEDYKRAEEYFNLALPYFVKANNELWVRNTNYNLGNVHSKLKNHQKAYEIYSSLETDYLENGNLVEAGYCNMGKGDALHNQKKYTEAIENYLLAIERIDTTNDAYTHALVLQNMAFSLNELDKDGEAKHRIHKSLSIALKNNFTKIQLTNVELLAAIHSKNKQLDSANYYLQKVIDLKVKVFDETKQAEFASYETKFKTKLNEEEIAYQKKLIDEKNRLINILAVILSIVLILIIVLILTYQKLRKKRRELLVTIDEKESLLREIHHRVKNNLQVVSSLLNMHVRKVKDSESKKILEDGSERLLAMAIIHKNLYPHSDLKTISLDDYLFTLCNQLFENYQLNYSNVELETELEKISVDIDKLVPIGLIVNELISNSMKHAFNEESNAKITVRLSSGLNDNIELEISDNGKGIEPNLNIEKNESIGMKLISIFSEKLKSKLSIVTDSGTKVKLSIPKY